MVVNINSDYQLVFGDQYFFFNGKIDSDRKQMIKSFTKNILISITLQDDNQYWVYNFVTKSLMIQSGDKGEMKLKVSYREDYDTSFYSIPLEGISTEDKNELIAYLESWMYDQTLM